MKKKKSFFNRGLTLFSLAALIVVGLVGSVPVAPAHAAGSLVCAQPGKDSPSGTITLSGIVNTYYPGKDSTSLSSGNTSIYIDPDTNTWKGDTTKSITSGDLLLIIQMQDVSYNSSASSAYGYGSAGGAGNGYLSIGNTGLHEYVRATSTPDPTTGQITIIGNTAGGLQYNYVADRTPSSGGSIAKGQSTYQIIRVPQYLNAVLSTSVPAVAFAWNGLVGGVFVIDVENVLDTTTGTISVAGRGFRGGAGLQLTGTTGATYPGATTIQDGVFAVNGPSSISSLPTTGSHAIKGEGIAGTPHYMYAPGQSTSVATVNTYLDGSGNGYPGGDFGHGSPGSAGGGGEDTAPVANTNNSGGGGGSNDSFGGLGGASSNDGNTNKYAGGRGAVGLDTVITYNRLFMGGGGGAGVNRYATDNSNGGVGGDVTKGLLSSGGAGGGIILLRSKYITGVGTLNANGAPSIVANGSLRLGKPNPNAGDAAGGGGAGGSISILPRLGYLNTTTNSVTSNLSNITARVRGGDGGNSNYDALPSGQPGNRVGPGGGGGGGIIETTDNTVNNNVGQGNAGTTTKDDDGFGTITRDSFNATNGGSGNVRVTNQTPDIPGGAACASAQLDTTSQRSASPLTSPGTDTFFVRFRNTSSEQYPTNGVPLTLTGFNFSFSTTLFDPAAFNPATDCQSIANYANTPIQAISGYTVSCGSPTVAGGIATVPLTVSGTVPTDDPTYGQAVIGVNARLTIKSGLSNGTPLNVNTAATYTFTDLAPGGLTYNHPAIYASSGDPNVACSAAPSGASGDNGCINFTEFAARMAYVESNVSGGKVAVKWATAMETNALGFNVYAVTPQGNKKLNQKIIPAHSLLGQRASTYSATFDAPAGTTSVIVSDVEPGGKATQHGPYTLGTTHGKAPNYAASADTTSRTPSVKPATSVKLARTDAALGITTDGIYRLSYEQLTRQGISFAGVRADKLALTVNGASVPLYVKAATANKFGAGDYIEFEATAIDTFYTGTNVYALTARPSGNTNRLSIAPSVSKQPATGSDAAKQVTISQPGRNFYWSQAPQDASAWNWALLGNFTDNTGDLADKNVAFDVPALYNAGSYGTQTAQIRLNLRGWGGYADAALDHHIVADFAGVHGEAKFNDWDSATITLNVPASALSASNNNIRLRTPGDMGVEYDTAVLQSITITYPKAIAPAAPLTSVASVRAFTRSAELNSSMTKQANGKKVDYLVIAYSDFVAGAAKLTAKHRNLRSAIVDVNAVYDSYTGGVADPQAIKRFIADAKAQRGIQYVVLAGAPNWDSRNYLDLGGFSYVPTFYVNDSAGTRAPSDAAFADTDNDGLPDVALGRLPVHTTTELAALIAKSDDLTGRTATATFVSDPTESSAATQTQANIAALPSNAQSTNISWTANDKASTAKATQALLAQWQTGVQNIVYTGHSNGDVWADDVVLDAGDVAAATTGKAALVGVWGCFAGTIDRPGINSLAQLLLTSKTGGAAAFIGASTEVSIEEQGPLATQFYGALYGKNAQTIGMALMNATRSTLSAHPTWRDVGNGMMLLGDPAARA